MRVAGEVMQHMLRSAKRLFGIDDPVFAKQCTKKLMERFCVGQVLTSSKKLQLVFAEELLQAGHELSPKHAAENAHRQEETLLRMNPALLVWRKATAWHHTMDMWMRLQGLSPRMQNTQEANQSAEAFRVGGYFKQRSGGGLEQEIEQDAFVLPHEWNEPMRHAEDDVIVSDG
jgi:hypothetical protein